MKPLSLTIRGLRHTWSFTFLGDPAHIDGWRADGLQVEELVASVQVSDEELSRLSSYCSEVRQ